MIAAAEPDLAAKFAAGDPDGVRFVYQRYARLVYAVAFKLLGERGLAEEATQQTFLSAWRAAASFDASRELGPWLATIARRTAIDIHRREARRPVGVGLEQVDPSAPELVTRPVGIETAYEIWEVRRALDELPRRRAATRPSGPLRGTHSYRDRRAARPAGRHGQVAHLPGPPPAGRAARASTRVSGRLRTPHRLRIPPPTDASEPPIAR
jgi:RNA polymerase sigma factor (sigma-70 family)